MNGATNADNAAIESARAHRVRVWLVVAFVQLVPNWALLEPHSQATFGTQANALFRKDLAYQKRNTRSNCRIILSPIFVSLLLLVIQAAVDSAIDKPANRVSYHHWCLSAHNLVSTQVSLRWFACCSVAASV